MITVPLKKRTIDRNLTKKGFAKDVSHDHILYVYVNPRTNCETGIRTKMSHNNDDIDDDLISAMSRQIHLSKSDFLKFVQCHIDRTRYNEMMIDIGLVI